MDLAPVIQLKGGRVEPRFGVVVTVADVLKGVCLPLVVELADVVE